MLLLTPFRLVAAAGLGFFPNRVLGRGFGAGGCPASLLYARTGLLLVLHRQRLDVFYLLVRQASRLPGAQAANVDAADPRSHQFADGMPEACQHPADLSVAALP